MSLNFLATRFQCTWPWSTLVMLCDGRMVCGCADPYGRRVLGDVRTSTVHEVWTGPVVSTLRAELNDGGSRFCGDCPLKLPLKKDDPAVVRLVHSGIDEVTFSIDGATQESYVKYRQRGRFDLALANLRAMADEKRKSGRDLPFLNWRYILFVWNDGEEEMDRARRLAEEIGV